MDSRKLLVRMVSVLRNICETANIGVGISGKNYQMALQTNSDRYYSDSSLYAGDYITQIKVAQPIDNLLIRYDKQCILC